VRAEKEAGEEMSDNRQVATTAPKTMRDMLALPSYQEQIQKALPRGLTAERMVRVVLTAINRTPKLLECTKETVWQAVLDAASLGLFPDALGRAYLVPYGSACQLIVGYKGLIDLMYRSGQIDFIQAVAVHEGDEFKYRLGLNPDIAHAPCDNPGRWTHVYSVAKIKGCDTSSFVVMSRAEVEKVKARSRAAKNVPWVTDEEEMAKKTVIRRHAKILPMSAEVAQAMDCDGDQYTIEAAAEKARPATIDDIGKSDEKTVDATATVVEPEQKGDKNADPAF
jgi:recombination protein RecT